MVLMRAATPSTYILAPRSGILPSGTPPLGTPLLLPIPSPASSPPLLLPSTDCRVDVPEVTLPPRKRLCIAPSPRYKIGESSSTPTARPTGGFRVDYGFAGTMDAEIRHDLDRETAAREAWAQFMDASDTIRSEVRALRTMVLAQQTEIEDLRAADRRRQAQIVEALTLLRTLQT
ncbi:hypothetical protein Tco_1071966 [Tanacetum coccineum]